MNKIECLKDCNAACCRAIAFIGFDFLADEAQMIRDAGGKLHRLKDGYVMEELCPFLSDNNCVLHGDPKQPECCRDNIVGDWFCLHARMMMSVGQNWEVE